MFEENWIYRIVVILSLCVLLIWTYLTNEDTLLNYISGRFILDTRLIWQVSIFLLLSLVLFYLMHSTLDYKSQNDVLKTYVQRLQQELDGERNAVKDVKSDANKELMRLESFIVTISDMAKQINSVLETEALLRVFLRKAIDLLNPEYCAVFKIDRDKQNLVYIDSIGYDKGNMERLSLRCNEDSGQPGFAAKTGLMAYSATLEQDPTRKHILNNDKFEVEYSQPIVRNFETVALLCVQSVSKNLTPEQVARLLSTLANFGSVALTNTELVDKIREQSRRDSLTWLYNHQYFLETLNALLNRCQRSNEIFSIAMIDIDFFKDINDTYGHLAGDYVLKEVSKTLSSELRGGDIISRYGGEEFAILLPSRDIKTGYDISERIRNRFEKSTFKYEDSLIKFTISAGLTAFNPAQHKKLNRDQLIKIADEALYEAKKKGRNRVEIL